MRVNVYAEEMTENIEIISKVIDGHEFTGLRIYLHLPVTLNVPAAMKGSEPYNVAGPFIHHASKNAAGQALHDDDSSAVTFWGKQDLRTVLKLALEKLDAHYDKRNPLASPPP